MKVVYDYQAFSWAKYSGISRYIYEIASRIAGNNKFEIEILAGLYANDYLKHCKPGLVKGWKIPLIPKLAKPTNLINCILSKYWLKKSDFSILHETYYSANNIAPEGRTVVLTVYDMIHEKMGHYLPEKSRDFAKVKKAAIMRADHIICISDNTKKDLLDIYDLDPKIISTTHLGSSLSIPHKSEKKMAKRFINSPYILYVGERKLKYKNFTNLLIAYATCKQLRQGLKLVCVGMHSFSQDETNEIRKLNLKADQVIHVSAGDELLSNLYTHATALVYPSLYEGFGIPLLEAMSFGCPVICSNTSSIPEVVGSAGQYFDPHNIDNIVDSIAKVIFSTELSNELIKLGKERAKLFSWEACANKTQSIYESLV